MDTLQRLPFQAQNAVFKKLESIANLASLSRKERRKYDSAIKAYRDYHNQMDFAKEEGIAIGEQRGKEMAIIATARNFKKLGASMEMIQKATGLSLQEIDKL